MLIIEKTGWDGQMEQHTDALCRLCSFFSKPKTPLKSNLSINLSMAFPRGSTVKNPPVNARDAGGLGLILGQGRSPGGGGRQPTRVVLSGESHGQRSLVSYNLWGHKKSDTTEATEHAYVCVCVCVCVCIAFLASLDDYL